MYYNGRMYYHGQEHKIIFYSKVEYVEKGMEESTPYNLKLG